MRSIEVKINERIMDVLFSLDRRSIRDMRESKCPFTSVLFTLCHILNYVNLFVHTYEYIIKIFSKM